MNNFYKSFTKLYNLSTAARTWLVFKTNFTAAHENLRQVCGCTMHSGALNHQANGISSRILNEVKYERGEYLNATSAAESCILQAFEVSTPPLLSEKTKVQLQELSVNNVSNDNKLLEVLKLLKYMKNDQGNQSKYNNSNRNNNRKRNDDGNNHANTSNNSQNNHQCKGNSNNPLTKKRDRICLSIVTHIEHVHTKEKTERTKQMVIKMTQPLKT